MRPAARPDTPNDADGIYGQSGGTTIVSVTPGETYRGGGHPRRAARIAARKNERLPEGSRSSTFDLVRYYRIVNSCSPYETLPLMSVAIHLNLVSDVM